MPNYDFSKDLPVAIKTEQEIAERLEKVYGSVIMQFEKTNKYDLLVRANGLDYDPTKILKIEIKEDFTCERTDNVGLEFQCRGKPSGINVTEADYYIYKLHTKTDGIQYVMHSVPALRKKIANGEYFRIVSGGDEGSNSMNYLFKRNIFLKDGKILPLDK
jgi:hypothetical protein